MNSNRMAPTRREVLRAGMLFADSALILVSLLYSKASWGQEVTGCLPVSQRTTEVGCWVLSNEPIGQLSKTPVYWYLETYENRAAAETDKGPHGAVVESFGKPTCCGESGCRSDR